MVLLMLKVSRFVLDIISSLIDDNVQTITYYRDADGDGYGTNTLTIQSCSPKAGYVSVGGDCNDKNAKINPGMTEICGNGIDDNCNGQIDENCVLTSITINDPVIYESQDVVRITVSLSSACTSTVKVNYQSSDGTTTAGKDYKAVSGTLSIPAGSLTGTISITILSDKPTEPDEVFYVNLSTPIGATISKNKGTVTIKDRAPPITAPITNRQSEQQQLKVDALTVGALPSPSFNEFKVNAMSSSKEILHVEVYDILGRTIEKRNVQANSTFLIGAKFTSGTYLLQVTQGKQKQVLKLVQQ